MAEKKRINFSSLDFILLILLIISLLVIIYLLLNPRTIIKNNYYEKKDNNLISLMIQNEKGDYEQRDDLVWPDAKKYRFNEAYSKCENGSKIKWDSNLENVEIAAQGSDKCYIYFDTNAFVPDLSGNGNNGKTYNIVSWDEEGITTSNEKQKGYVNCGLAGYDFKAQITIVARFKLIDSIPTEYNPYPFRNNSGGRGVGFAISNPRQAFGSEITIGEPFQNKWISGDDNSIAHLNEWYTLVETYDGQMQKIYINGELKKENNLTGDINISPFPFILGASPSNAEGTAVFNYTYAIFTDALIFTRPLTAEEVTSDYAQTVNPHNKQGLLLWYSF